MTDVTPSPGLPGAKKERWGTRVGLVLAVAGNAVGLGNFLRFPAQAAQNGGGAFLIPYLISFLLMGLPLLWVEWAIGRHGGQYGHHASPGMFARMGRGSWLKYVGVFGLFTNLTVAAYYCYIESWTLAYVWHSLVGTFQHTPATTFFPEYLGTTNPSIAAVPYEAACWFIGTLALNTWILSRGLVKGVELAAKIGMPLLLLFGVVLAIKGLTLGPGDPGVVESPLVGLNFVWQPQTSGLWNPSTWLAAAGQVFFTLSVGMGSIHCYAAYLRERDDIALNATTAGAVNEFVEVVLGSAILIPIATAYLGLNLVQAATAGGSGFDLAFLTLPTLFNQWGAFGPIACAMWFGLLFFAGITSSLAMGQPVVAFLQDEFKTRRGAGGRRVRRRHARARHDVRDPLPGRHLRRVRLLDRHLLAHHLRVRRGDHLRLDLRHRARLGRDQPRRRPQAARLLQVRDQVRDPGLHRRGPARRPHQAGRRLGRRAVQPPEHRTLALRPGSVIGKLFHVGETESWFAPAARSPACSSRTSPASSSSPCLSSSPCSSARPSRAGTTFTNETQEGPRP
jgi:SNF family Na+-dependent transporter